MARDKEQTKQRIIAAVGEQLAQHGFRDLGVNSIARAAGIDKVLIYRYFGGLPELLHAYGQEGNYWPTAQELIGDNPDNVPADSAAEWLIYILTKVQMSIRQRPITKEILRWEIVDHNELTHEFAAIRSRVALECITFVNQRHPLPPNLDTLALATVILSAVIYVVLRTDHNPDHLGMDFSEPAAWERINTMIVSLINQSTEKRVSEPSLR
jgi:AcrR family transcriptional regulator